MKPMVKKFNEFVNEYFHYDYKDAPSTSDERPAESRFNMLPKGLKNELPRSLDRKSTRLNSSHSQQSRMPSSA